MTLTIRTNPSAITDYRRGIFQEVLGKFLATHPNLGFTSSWDDDCIKKVDELGTDNWAYRLARTTVETTYFGFLNRGSKTKIVALDPRFGYISFNSQPERDTGSCEIVSYSLAGDELWKEIAVEMAKHFNTELSLYRYSGKNEVGALKCAYCGQFTHDVEKCEFCGANPLKG